MASFNQYSNPHRLLMIKEAITGMVYETQNVKLLKYNSIDSATLEVNCWSARQSLIKMSL